MYYLGVHKLTIHRKTGRKKMHANQALSGPNIELLAPTEPRGGVLRTPPSAQRGR